LQSCLPLRHSRPSRSLLTHWTTQTPTYATSTPSSWYAHAHVLPVLPPAQPPVLPESRFGSCLVGTLRAYCDTVGTPLVQDHYLCMLPLASSHVETMLVRASGQRTDPTLCCPLLLLPICVVGLAATLPLPPHPSLPTAVRGAQGDAAAVWVAPAQRPPQQRRQG
jgi:hypothetical protein